MKRAAGSRDPEVAQWVDGGASGDIFDFDYAADDAGALRLEASLQGRAGKPTIAPVDIEPIDVGP